MNVIFSSRAKSELAEMVNFIPQDKPQAARRWASDIRKAVLKLPKFPRMGRTVPEYGDETTREIFKGPDRVVSKIDEKEDKIVIVAIHHARRPLL